MPIVSLMCFTQLPFLGYNRIIRYLTCTSLFHRSETYALFRASSRARRRACTDRLRNAAAGWSGSALAAGAVDLLAAAVSVCTPGAARAAAWHCAQPLQPGAGGGSGLWPALAPADA